MPSRQPYRMPSRQPYRMPSRQPYRMPSRQARPPANPPIPAQSPPPLRPAPEEPPLPRQAVPQPRPLHKGWEGVGAACMSAARLFRNRSPYTSKQHGSTRQKGGRKGGGHMGQAGRQGGGGQLASRPVRVPHGSQHPQWPQRNSLPCARVETSPYRLVWSHHPGLSK
jgi:hypothetical protein